MGRMKPAWYYQRQATISEARATYFANKTPTAPGPIQERGAATDLYYRSLTLTDGTNPLIFRVSVLNDTLALMTAADLGLVETLGAGEIALRLRGSGIKPTKIHWYEGAATPVRTNTPWGSSVSRYYDNAGKSHFSAPFSERVGVFTAAALRENFETLFGVGGLKRNLLGLKHGRAWMELEQAPVSAMT